MTPSDKNDIARQLERLADEVKDLKMGLSAHKPVYTNSELMKLLDTSTATIKKWRDAGLLGYSQVGDTYFYSKEDVESFLLGIHHKATAITIKLENPRACDPLNPV